MKFSSLFSLFSLILFLFFPSNLFPASLAALEGTVMDRQGKPVEAQVTLVSLDHGFRRATLSIGGAFHFEELVPGPYYLSVTALGFREETVRISLQPEEARQLGIELAVQGLSETVVVTATNTGETLSVTGKALSVVNRDELEIVDPLSLGEAVRHLPGVRVQRLGGPLSFTNIRVRGLRNQDTAILIDGFRFRDVSTIDADATSFLQDLVLFNTEQIEVLRGSSSSTHGTHALGGVVNLITHRGRSGLRGSILAQGGGLGTYRGIVSAEGGSDDGRLTFSGGLSHVNVVDGIDGDDPARNSGGHFRFDWNLAPGMTFGGRFLGADTFAKLNDSPFALPENIDSSWNEVPARPLPDDAVRDLAQGEEVDFGSATFVPALNDPDNRRSSRFATALFDFHHQLNSRASYLLGYNVVATERVFEDGPGGVRFEPFSTTRSDLEGTLHTLRGRFDYLFSPSHFFSIGYELEDEEFRSLDRGAGVESRATLNQKSHALFVQDRLFFLDRNLQLSVAGRAQWYRLSDPQVSQLQAPLLDVDRIDAPPTSWTGDVSVSYQLGEATRIRGHLGNGYRTPSLFNRFGTSFFAGTLDLFGNPLLEPEKSIGVDLGIEQTLAGERVRVGATYFYTSLDDLIVFEFFGFDPETDPFGRTSGYRNADGGLSRGVEVSFQAEPKAGFRFYGAYTYTNADEATELISNFSNSLGVSDHQLALGAVLRPDARWDLFFNLDWLSEYPIRFFGVDKPFVFDGPIRADVGAGYRVFWSDDLTTRFYFRVDNLFDAENFENGFRTPGVIASGGVKLEF